MGTDNQEVEYMVLGDGAVDKIHKEFKGDTIEKLVCSFHYSIPIMNLAMLDDNIREYLLYSFFNAVCNWEAAITSEGSSNSNREQLRLD